MALSQWSSQDVRSCIEQLQTTEKEVQLLEGSQKELAELKDSLEYKKVERGELQKKTEVGHDIFPKHAC
jgi:kinetochore protein Nuf2